MMHRSEMSRQYVASILSVSLPDDSMPNPNRNENPPDFWNRSYSPHISFFLPSGNHRTMSYARRLRSECKHYKESVAEGITLEPDELSLLEWHCTIRAPDDTPYEKRVFDVKLRLPEDYPMHPPKAFFVSPIFHPNIHFVTGEVCLDILKSRWTPVWNLESVCLAIQVLLANPDPTSPLNYDAAVLLRSGDRVAYDSLARVVH